MILLFVSVYNSSVLKIFHHVIFYSLLFLFSVHYLFCVTNSSTCELPNTTALRQHEGLNISVTIVTAS